MSLIVASLVLIRLIYIFFVPEMARVEPETQNYDWKVMLSMNNDVVLISVCVLLLIQLLLSVLLVYYRSTRGKVSIRVNSSF